MLAFEGAKEPDASPIRRAMSWTDMVLAIEEEKRRNPDSRVIAFYFVKGGSMPVFSQPTKRDLKFKTVSFVSGVGAISATDLSDYDVFSFDASAVTGATCNATLPGSPPDGSYATISLTSPPTGAAAGLTIVPGGSDSVDGNPIVLTVTNEQVTLVYRDDGTSGTWLQV